jgi:hypothetical protein
MDCDSFYSREVDILSICGVVVPRAFISSVRERTAAQNPNQKSIETQIKNPSKSKIDINKIHRKSEQQIAKRMKTNNSPSLLLDFQGCGVDVCRRNA